MHKTKILFVIPTLGIGGTEKVMLTIAMEMENEKYDIYFVVISGPQLAPIIPINSKIKFFYLNSKRVLFSIRNFLRVIKDVKPDIIFSSLSHLNLYLTFFKKIHIIRKPKLIIRESIVLFLNINQTKNKFIYRFLPKFFYLASDKIICQSLDMYQDLRINYKIPNEKMVVINNPIGSVKKIISKNEKDIDSIFFSDKFNVLSIGRLVYQKGYDLLLTSIKLLNDKSYHFYIAGDGPEQKYLIEKSKLLNIEDEVTFLGLIYNPLSYIERSNIFILSSRYEGFPNVLLEAGICGIPTIAFNCPGGINEIIIEGVNGFLATPADPLSLCNAIKKSRNYNFDKNKIKEITNERYNNQTILRQYEKVFQETLLK